MASGEVDLAVLGAMMMLVLRRMYVVVEGMAAGIEVVGKAIEAIEAIEVVVCVLVMAEVCGLEAVSEVYKVWWA